MVPSVGVCVCHLPKQALKRGATHECTYLTLGIKHVEGLTA